MSDLNVLSDCALHQLMKNDTGKIWGVGFWMILNLVVNL